MRGWSVLDVSRQSVAASFCARLLSDAGLSVEQAEWPAADGHPDVPSRPPGRGLFLEAGTRAVSVADAAELRALALGFDIVVQGAPAAGELPFAADEFADGSADDGAAPLLVTVTPLGGDCAEPSPLDEFLVFHRSGLGHITPRSLAGYPTASLPPLRPRTHLLELIAGYQAAIAALATLVERSGAGSRDSEPRGGSGGNGIDVAVVHAGLPLLRRELAAYQYDGIVATRGERLWKVAPAGLVRCSDGIAFIDVVDEGQWRRLCELLGRLDLLDDERLSSSEARFREPDAIEAAIAPWFAARTMRDALAACQGAAVPIAPVNTMDDLLRDEQLAARGFFVPAGSGGAVVPRIPTTWHEASDDATDGATKTRRDAPPAAAPAAFSPEAPSPRGERRRAAANGAGVASVAGLPLLGYRVIEFTHVWAGPLCGQVLADLGADVIKIESRARLDVHRRAGPYPPGFSGIDASGVWNSQNRGKRSCAIDLSTSEGVALALRLVAESDAVIENFSPGTLARMGLGFDVLRSVQPEIVLASLSAFGQTGPLKGYFGYGPMMDAACGIMALADYGDGVPRAVNGWAADVGGALCGALQVVSALLAGRTEPRARWADVSEYECAVLFQFEELVAASLGGDAGASLATIETCLESLDDDRWVAVALRDAVSRGALARLVGHPDDPALVEAARVWARTIPRTDLLRALAAAGIPSGIVSTTQDILDDPELARSGRFVETVHSEVGPLSTYGPAWRFARRDGADLRPAPRLGEHTAEVLSGIAGVTPAELAALAAGGVLR
jgi:crotonobetainyl-CoA:carnitine CoA-transferase CaiB-like acyl-CoA transferase